MYFSAIGILLFYLPFKYYIGKKSLKLVKESSLNNQNKEKIQEKFKLSLWRFSIYSILLLYGIYALHDQKWILDPIGYVKIWEKKLIPSKIYFYYHLEFVHYIASLGFLFFEPKMKDFYQMLVHHIITLYLIIISYHRGNVKSGTVIMLLHDASDPFMEIAKCFNYLNYSKYANNIFIVFAIIFYISRCVIYPIFLCFPIVYYVPQNDKSIFTWLIVISATLLMFINFIWAFYISRMILVKLKEGIIKSGDIREQENDSIKKKR